jgi:competence ComEA-like helix-hairpin-helix protein
MASPTHHRAVALLLTGALALGVTRTLTDHGTGSPAAPPVADAAVEATAPGPAPVDPNTATQTELEALPGVGPALAARIIAARARGPRFRQAEDLERVRGIGPRTAARLAPWLRFGARTGDEDAAARADAARDPS